MIKLIRRIISNNAKAKFFFVDVCILFSLLIVLEIMYIIKYFTYFFNPISLFLQIKLLFVKNIEIIKYMCAFKIYLLIFLCSA